MFARHASGVMFMSETVLPKSELRSSDQANWRRRAAIRLRQVAPWLTLLVVLSLWQAVVALQLYPPFIIPPPIDVLRTAVEVIRDGSLLGHTLTTLVNVFAGLLIGVGLALLLGYAIARVPLLEDILSPLIVALQSTPVVAYAPLLVIWFGSDARSKIITSALIVFFPMLMNTVVGLRNVPLQLRDLMRTMQATPWQTFTKLEVPAALPVLLSGLKVSATLAVIGAVVGEFINASAGLGFLINLARSQYDTPLVMVAVLTLTIMARSLYSLVVMIERQLLSWQLRARRSTTV